MGEGGRIARVAEPIVRSMRPEDVAETLDMFAAVAAEGMWLGTAPGFDRAARAEAWLASLADTTRRSLLVLDPDRGRILGNGSIQVAAYGVAELGMALAADVRGRGLGGQLLDALIAAARELGAHKVFLYVWPHNDRALRLYLSRRFAVEGRLRAGDVETRHRGHSTLARDPHLLAHLLNLAGGVFPLAGPPSPIRVECCGITVEVEVGDRAEVVQPQVAVGGDLRHDLREG